MLKLACVFSVLVGARIIPDKLPNLILLHILLFRFLKESGAPLFTIFYEFLHHCFNCGIVTHIVVDTSFSLFSISFCVYVYTVFIFQNYKQCSGKHPLLISIMIVLQLILSHMDILVRSI